MAITTLLINGVLAGSYATTMAIVFTAPAAYLSRAFVCALSVRIARDLLVSTGINPDWATMGAALTAVIVAVAITPNRAVQPLVLVVSLLQLAAGTAIFNVIFQLMRVSSAEGTALAEASVRLTSNVGQAFTRFLAIGIGLQLGLALTRAAHRRWSPD